MSKNSNKNPQMMKRPPMKKGVLKRLFKMLFADYKLKLIIVAVCLLLTSFASTIASFFMNLFITYIEEGLAGGWDSVKVKVYTAVGIMLSIYAVGCSSSSIRTLLNSLKPCPFISRLP